MKLCLGTAQFGLDYGINNSRGKIPESEISEILNYAHASKVSDDVVANYVVGVLTEL